jgi:hypothetical protein
MNECDTTKPDTLFDLRLAIEDEALRAQGIEAAVAGLRECNNAVDGVMALVGAHRERLLRLMERAIALDGAQPKSNFMSHDAEGAITLAHDLGGGVG